MVFRVGLSCFSEVLWKCLYMHTPCFIFQVLPDGQLGGFYSFLKIMKLKKRRQIPLSSLCREQCSTPALPAPVCEHPGIGNLGLANPSFPGFLKLL